MIFFFGRKLRLKDALDKIKSSNLPQVNAWLIASDKDGTILSKEKESLGKCWNILWLYRSSRLYVICKKGVLGNFAKFTGKHLCQSLSFNKVAGLRLQTLLKEKLWHRCFPVNFAKFSRTSFLTEHLRTTASDYNHNNL